jgi:glycosyltransferase involved in cell wall biosynthesis
VTVDMLPGFGSPRVRVFLRRLRLWAARKLARRPGVNSIESLGPASSLLRAARQQPADLIIVHNEIAHWVGAKLLDEGRTVAADFEDWHSEDLLPADRRHRPLQALRDIEQTLLRRAAYTTTTSHALADALQARYGGRRPMVLTNSFPLQADFRRESPSAPPAFFWFSQTIGPGRGLEPFIAAWVRMSRPSRLVLLGESAGGFAPQLLASVPAEWRPRIKFLDLVPMAELPSLVARHDVGLALEPASSRNNDLTISNKILQYLNAGLAVVATPTAGQREVLARAPGAGVLIDFDSPALAAAALDELVGDPVRLAAAQRCARTAAEKTYCWERESPGLLAQVAAALEQPAP